MKSLVFSSFLVAIIETIKASVESRPPDIPMTRHFELLAKTLLARPELWISNISNARSLSSIESFGTNGCFDTILFSSSMGGRAA